MNDEAEDQKKKEMQAFLFLTVVIAPIFAIAIVGTYGLMIWVYQLLMGPPIG